MDLPLLTIAVPTYNRSAYLDKCLHSICSQLNASFGIELIVANNASTDNTDEIVKKYISQGYAINYILRPENIGAEKNFGDCFSRATGKYLWIIGDDDFIVPNALSPIIDLLKNNDCGVVRVKAMGYQQEADLKYELVNGELNVTQYSSPIAFFTDYHFWATFISGCIINRSVLINKIDPFEFDNTSLIQLGWNIPAAFSKEKNVIIETALIAAKGNNTGGYKLATTFCKNYNYVLRSLVNNGYDKQIIPITNNKLYSEFFPGFISFLLYRKNDFRKENHFFILLNNGWKYRTYWVNIFTVYLKYYLKVLFPFVTKIRKNK